MARHNLRIAILGSFLLATFGALGLLVLHHDASPPVHAQVAQSGTACSNASFSGTYGQLVQGFLVTAPDGTPLAAPVPLVGVNIATADGAGNISRSGTTNRGGTVSPNPATGTYMVNPDCSFTIAYSSAGPNGTPTHLAGALVDGGKKAFVIQTDPYVVLTMTWERQ